MTLETKREIGQKVFILWKWKIYHVEIIGIHLAFDGNSCKEGYWLRGDFKDDQYFSENKVFNTKEECINSLEP